MPSLRERWRAGRSEFVILVGCLVAFGGNYASLAWTFLSAPPTTWALPTALTAIELALCFATPLPLVVRKARTARPFALTGVLATAMALLTVPGLVGGGVALTGAIGGILATYEGVPDAPPR